MAEFTLPFSALNNLPAVSGIDDVTVETVTPIELEDRVEQLLGQEIPGPEDILELLDESQNELSPIVGAVLDDVLFEKRRGGTGPSQLLQDIAGAIAEEVDISGVTSDDIIESVLEALDVEDGQIVLSIEGSLFATDSDFVDLLVEAIEEAGALDLDVGDIDLDGLAEDVTSILNTVDSIDQRLDDDLLPGTEELIEEIRDEFEDIILELVPVQFFEEPVEWIRENVVNELGDTPPDVAEDLDELEERFDTS